MNIRLYKTEDGSFSLFNEALKETYHSKHGAVNESLHVFIKSGLSEASVKINTIRILEVGFGTGLNALLTADYCYINNVKVYYTTLEPYPIDQVVYKQLNYSEYCRLPNGLNLFIQLHQAPWEEEISIANNFTFKKSQSGIDQFDLPDDFFDLIYFDAFAPDIQPELWTTKIFEKIYNTTATNGILVTYAAKGQVRRDLQSVGFHVERIPGPKGKREMLRGKKLL
jgi:tRNA U34 5-methylaminomethyl-2-thiouridine-forming methyltransferase MnmC